MRRVAGSSCGQWTHRTQHSGWWRPASTASSPTIPSGFGPTSRASRVAEAVRRSGLDISGTRRALGAGGGRGQERECLACGPREAGAAHGSGATGAAARSDRLGVVGAPAGVVVDARLDSIQALAQIAIILP